MSPQKWIAIVLSSSLILTSSFSLGQTERLVKRNIATVLFASLGGAVLGLSTLSFYGDPEEHTNNIGTGALLGFLGGVSYLAYDSSRPGAPVYDYSQSFGIDYRSRRASATQVAKSLPLVQYSFTF